MTKLIRPLFYFCRRGVNDIYWIIKKFKVIPEDRRQEVTNHYEKLLKFNEGYPGRDEANKYLQAVAEEYRPERPERVVKLKVKASKVSKKPGQKYNSSCGLWRTDIG
jgi:hypothetical protein